MSKNLINLLVGIILTFMAGIAIDTLAYFGLDKGTATFIILLFINIGLLFVYYEKFTINNIIYYIISAATLAISYFYFLYLRNNVSISITSTNGWFGIVVYIINIVILIPIFEETIVRKLIFMSSKKYVGLTTSAIITSLLFAIVHDGMFILAFVLSIVLCVMTNYGVNVYKRSIFHGSYNLVYGLLLLKYANVI